MKGLGGKEKPLSKKSVKTTTSPVCGMGTASPSAGRHLISPWEGSSPSATILSSVFFVTVEGSQDCSIIACLSSSENCSHGMFTSSSSGEEASLRLVRRIWRKDW